MEARGEKIDNPLAVQQAQSEINLRSNENDQRIDDNISTIQDATEKPKRKYTRKKQTESESENIEQIDASEGTSD